MGKFSKYSNSRKKKRRSNQTINQKNNRRNNRRKSIKQQKYKQNGGNPVSWIFNHMKTDMRNLVNTWLPLSYDVKNAPSEFVHNVRGKEWKDNMTGDPVKQKLDLDAKIKPAIVSLPALLRTAQNNSIGAAARQKAQDANAEATLAAIQSGASPQQGGRRYNKKKNT